jgi:outer membrane protein assembly factor BamB
VPPPSNSPLDATNFQVNARHDGWAAGPGLSRSLHPLWSHRLGGFPSYAVIAGGTVFVSEQNGADLSYYVDAFDGKTGTRLWRSKLIIGSGFPFQALAYASGRVFFTAYQSGLVALDARTGAVDWVYPVGTSWINAEPVTANGKVYIAVQGQTQSVIALDQVTGAALWGGRIYDGENEAPAVTADGVYVDGACHYVQRFSLAGSLLWSRNDGCYGGGGTMTVVHGNQVWARDYRSQQPTALILDTRTGRQVATFPSNGSTPSFDGNTVLLLDGLGITARSTVTRAILWHQSGDPSGMRPPIVAGHVAYTGSGSGNLYGFSTATGAKVWQASVKIAVPSGRSPGVSSINIGDGLLAATVDQTLVVLGG